MVVKSALWLDGPRLDLRIGFEHSASTIGTSNSIGVLLSGAFEASLGETGDGSIRIRKVALYKWARPCFWQRGKKDLHLAGLF